MDTQLKDLIKLAETTHDQLEKYNVILSIKDLEEKVHILQQNIKTIQAVSKRLADVSNIASRLIIKKKIDNKINTPTKVLDPYPTEFDYATVKTLYSKEKKPLTTDVEIPVKIVNEISEIPVSELYYVNSLRQFAVNIQGVVIKGNLGNINTYQTERTARCEYGTECKSILSNKLCDYYHDPEDYIKLSKPIPDCIRNFTVGSWLYSRNKNYKTYFTRHIGSRERLLYDLATLKKVQYREEISNREGQLIHDLLVYMLLNNKGYLEKYPHWTK